MALKHQSNVKIGAFSKAPCRIRKSFHLRITIYTTLVLLTSHNKNYLKHTQSERKNFVYEY